MKIHLICPVRGVTDEQQKEIDDYAAKLVAKGHTVHNPKYAVDQDDATGYRICWGHLESMKIANRVDVFWDVNSKGSHFDIGMAFAMNKAIKLVKAYQPDNEGKSYLKVLQEYQKETERCQKILDVYPELIKKAKEEKLKYVKVQNFEKATEARGKERDLLESLELAAHHFNLINIYKEAINI
jgi:hypothetical protein